MKTLHDSWRRFERLVLDPAKASDVERRRARLTYYAGVAAMFDLVTEIGTDAYTENQGVEQFEAVRQELEAFARTEVAFVALRPGKDTRA